MGFDALDILKPSCARLSKLGKVPQVRERLPMLPAPLFIRACMALDMWLKNDSPGITQVRLQPVQLGRLRSIGAIRPSLARRVRIVHVRARARTVDDAQVIICHGQFTRSRDRRI